MHSFKIIAQFLKKKFLIIVNFEEKCVILEAPDIPKGNLGIGVFSGVKFNSKQLSFIIQRKSVKNFQN